MAHADANAVIAAAVDTLSHQVGGFEAVGDWHPWLASALSGHGPGAERTIRWRSDFDVAGADEQEAIRLIEDFLTAELAELLRRYA